MGNSEENKSEEKKSYFIHWLLGGAVGVFIGVMLLFFYINKWTLPIVNDENNTLSNLGTIGDYFGGLINPLLGFVSFCALLYTIHIQREELGMTKKELARSADAQEQSSAIFKQQQFETTFFSLINQLNKEIDAFNAYVIHKPESEYISKQERNKLIEFIRAKTYTSSNVPIYLTRKPIEDVKDSFERRLEELMGELYYFHNLIAKIPVLIKVMLELIKSFDFKDSDLEPRKNFYTNILKSNLTREVLYIIAIIGYEDDSLSILIEEYNLLEFMPFRFSPDEDPHPILRLIAYKYQYNIFRENIYLQDLMEFEQWMIDIKNYHTKEANQDEETTNAN